MASERVNARLDDETVRRMEYLETRLGVSASEVVRRALNELYERERVQDGASVLEVLQGAGFLGGFDGDEDLSDNYKQQLSEGWSRKT